MANAHAVHEPQHGATPPTASLAAHHHLRHSLFLTTSACPIDSCELVDTATGPPASPTTHGVGWVDQTGVVADVRAVNGAQPGAMRQTTSLAAHHRLQHTLNPSTGAHLTHACELIGTATSTRRCVSRSIGCRGRRPCCERATQCNISHCLTSRSSSPVPLSKLHGRCTPHLRL
jgi:hypothetical protein